MPIYNIFEHTDKDRLVESDVASSSHLSEFTLRQKTERDPDKGSLFSTITARMFFFVLFCVNFLWGLYTLAILSISLFGTLLTLCRVKNIKIILAKKYLNLKRSSICFIALLVSLFSPALGTMIACSYFLMFDKKGIKEVVPVILQDQFEEFFEPLKQS